MIKNISALGFTGKLEAPENTREMFVKRHWEDPAACLKVVIEAKKYAEEKLPEGDTLKLKFTPRFFEEMAPPAGFIYIPGKESKNKGMFKDGSGADGFADCFLKKALSDIKEKINKQFQSIEEEKKLKG